MAVRILELHRILKSDGSLYLHCDPTASHYVKVLLFVFGCGGYISQLKCDFKDEYAFRNVFDDAGNDAVIQSTGSYSGSGN